MVDELVPAISTEIFVDPKNKLNMHTTQPLLQLDILKLCPKFNNCYI